MGKTDEAINELRNTRWRALPTLGISDPFALAWTVISDGEWGGENTLVVIAGKLPRVLAEHIADTHNASLAADGVSPRVEVMGEWQPIETARKDGTKIDLLYPYPRGRQIDCYWHKAPFDGWVRREPLWEDGELRPEEEWSYAMLPSMEPTHWMPRPDAPRSGVETNSAGAPVDTPDKPFARDLTPAELKAMEHATLKAHAELARLLTPGSPEMATLSGMEHAKNEYATLAANRWTEIERLQKALSGLLLWVAETHRGEWNSITTPDAIVEACAALTPPRTEGDKGE